MRFDFLYLKAFGHFHERKIEFDPNKNFHLLYGLNEAGKSTMLRAISNLLYGFPQQTPDAFKYGNQKLRVGGQLTDRNGNSLAFLRRKGNKNTVLDMDGHVIDEKNVSQFLHGLSEQQFRNMFALDHVRLREGGESLLANEGEAGESLFSAASGITMLRKVLDELENKARELYVKSGSKRLINQELKKEKELTKKVADNMLKIQTWKELEQRYAAGKKNIEQLKRQIRELATKEMKYERLKRTLPIIAMLQEVTNSIKNLTDAPELPEDSEQIRKESLAKIEQAQKIITTAEENMKSVQQELEQIAIPEKLLEQEAVIEALYREVESYKNNVESLPALEGQYIQLQERLLQLLKELHPDNTSVQHAEQYRIPIEQKKMIQKLYDQYPLLEKELQTAKKEIAVLKHEIEKQLSDLKKLGEPIDSQQLELVIKQVRSEGNLEERIEQSETKLVQIEREIDQSIRRLPLWDGAIDEFVKLPVPNLTNTIKKYGNIKQELEHERKRLKENIAQEMEKINKNEERIRELESVVNIPTETDLQQIRAFRNSGWLVIRNKLNNIEIEHEKLAQFTKGLPLDIAFEKSVRDADEVADVMRREAEKLGEKNKLISDIEASKKKVKLLEKEYENIEKAIEKWEQDWNREWQQAEIEPLSPDEMLEWLESYRHILSLVSQQQEMEKEANLHKTKREQMRKLLLESLLELNIEIAKESSLTELLHIAEKMNNKLMDKKNRRSYLEEGLKATKEKYAKALEQHNIICEQIDKWKLSWAASIQGLAILEDTYPDVVKQLLEKYDECVQVYDELKQIKKTISLTKEQIALFKEKVSRIQHPLAKELDDIALDVVVIEIYKVLQQAKQDKLNVKNLHEKRQIFEKDKHKAEIEMKEAKGKLNKLFEIAQCKTLEEYEKVETIFYEKKKREEKIDELKDKLIETGDGLTLDELLEEAKHVTIDLIENELAEIRLKKQELDEERSVLEQDYGVVKKEYEEKIKGTNNLSIQALAEKQSTLAKIVNLTDNYINYKLASLLIKKGIDYYREQNQNPIIQRASELFQQLTLYSFDGLSVEFDEKDQAIIMGVRHGDEKVKITGMSDGTTDQLYLALRIASIEQYVRENEPIPFIVDDILVHFDDERSKETLKILLQLSTKTQILFFTHHARMLELMSEITSEEYYQVEEISREPSFMLQ